jgi:hypothetical protein
MQSENHMNIKQQIIRLSKALGLMVTMLLAYSDLSAQCNITVGGPACVGEPVLFSCNSPGSSNYNWDFNGEGSNTSLCNPTFVFNLSLIHI